MRKAVTWKSLVLDVVRSMPPVFTLRDMEARHDYFARHYPENRFIAAKIRQSLQILEHQGTIRRLERGVYERVSEERTFSPFFAPDIASNYVSRSQQAKLYTETWAEHNLYCLNCPSDELSPLPQNTKVSDFQCLACTARYQLKSKNGRFGPRLNGANYRTTVEAIRLGAMPNHVLVEYDLRFSVAVFVWGIPGSLFSEDRIVARNPLRATARRAGWQGCQIVIDGLARVNIVQPAGLPKAEARRMWLDLQDRAAF